MGLLDNISNNKSTFSEINHKNLTKVIEGALFSNIKESDSIVMYTGLLGMYIFNLTMMGFGVPVVHYSLETCNRTRNIIILNLFKKYGFLKAIINTKLRTVEIRQGTQILKVIEQPKELDLKLLAFDKLKDYLSKLDPKEPQKFYLRNGQRKFIR